MTRLSNGAKHPSLLAAQAKWQSLVDTKETIDYTRLSIADAPPGGHSDFSFLVLGDTDMGDVSVAEQAFAHSFAAQVMSNLGGTDRFLLHTGDVTYPVGSYENYLKYFLRPFQDLLTQLPESACYRDDPVIFNRPLLTVPGNHDYAGSEIASSLLHRILRGVCDRLRLSFGIDWGHYGGQGGEAYAQTFLDDLASLSPLQLAAHLKAHYTA